AGPEGMEEGVQVRLRGIRGAITVAENSEEAILDGSEQLLAEILRRNRVHPEDVAAIFFTATEDLTAAFPAAAARRLGLDAVPTICSRERSEEHTSELQSRENLVCRLLLE